MKLMIGMLIALGALVGLCGIATGVISLNQTPTITTVQGSPALQPLAAQATDNNDLIVTVSERYLNKQLSEGSPRGDRVSNVSLDVHEGDVANVSATVQINSLLTVQPNATVKLGAVNGRITIDVQKVEVSGFGVPSNLIESQIEDLKSNAETELNNQLADLQRTTGLKLQTVSTTENSLTLYFAP